MLTTPRPTEKSPLLGANHALPKPIPHKKKSSYAHTKSILSVAALMDTMWMIGWKRSEVLVEKYANTGQIAKAAGG